MKNIKSLTPDQIQAIFDFTSKKYIKYYDVQLELVDHIANKIEELQVGDPKLSFDQALQQVYKSFGIFGFTKVQENKMHQLQKEWSSRMLSYYYRYFKLPKLLLTLLLSLGFFMYYHILSIFQLDHLVFSLTLLCIPAIFALIGLQKVKKRRIRSERKYLVIQSFYSALSSTSVIGSFLFPCYLQVFDFSAAQSIYSLNILIFISLFTALVSINLYAAVYVFPYWLDEEINTKYAHLDIKFA